MIQGLERAAEPLASAKDVFNRSVVEPEARAQAQRSLRRLSNRLDALAIAKEDFTASLLDAGTAGSNRSTRLEELRKELRDVRESLTSVFTPLPDE